jgi:hypothetical protein
MDKWEVLDEKVTLLARHHSQLRESVAVLTKTVNSHEETINAMRATQKTMAELLELFIAMKGGITVIGWVGTFIKWFWPVGAFFLALWIYAKTGKWNLSP